MPSALRIKEIRDLEDNVMMQNGALTDNVTFPAGHVIQTITKTETVTNTEQSGSNVIISSTFFNKSITAKGNNSIFVINAFIGKTYTQNTNSYGQVQLTRNLNSIVTELNQMTGGNVWGGIAVAVPGYYNAQSYCWVDNTSCSVGDTIDYVIKYVRHSNSGDSFYFIDGTNNGSYCTYIIQEIAA